MRISRALALAGIDSRRKCEAHVEKGDVKVNGEVVRDLGRQVDIGKDEILFRGARLDFEKPVYFILNKPAGFVTTASDPHAEKTVFDLLPGGLVPKSGRPGSDRTRVFPVGRLDKDSTGLLFFTNDGELANTLIHPRYGVAKWYEVWLDRPFDPEDEKRLLAGVLLEEGPAKIRELKVVSNRHLRVMIREGKKREIRRIFSAAGYGVTGLCRTDFGPLKLGGLKPGEVRFLGENEIRMLKLASDARGLRRVGKS